MNGGRLCIFGEVLFDHFPNGRRVLGGAPFNVAWHLQAFGQAPHLVSRVGDDPEGAEIVTAMAEWSMDTAGLQTDPDLPTGRVDIRFEDGEPAYEIVRPCAWDAIAEPAPMPGCRLLYHGSLALREPRSRTTLARLRETGPGTVFVDINLRPPWWERDRLEEMLQAAHWVKLNGDELATLSTPAGAQEYPVDAAGLLERYGLEGLILTRGSAGAELLTAAGGHRSVTPNAGVQVVDTVGAGDAFASVMILGIALGWDLGLTLERAQDFASRLVGNRGATVRDRDFYRPLIEEWQLDSTN